MRHRYDPWGYRRHPERYDPKVLREMLVGDIAAARPPGGPGEWGAAFLIGACGRIAKREGSTPDEVWKSICAEAAIRCGHTNVALA